MFSIYDGRESFYQWDLDRKLVVEDSSIKEVHFCNRTDDCSLVVETYTEDGLTLANVPNVLLQSDWRINVYAYDGKATKHSATFGVISRTKPSDYVYTETEVKSYEDLEKRVEKLERSGGGGGGSAKHSLWVYIYEQEDGTFRSEYSANEIYYAIWNDDRTIYLTCESWGDCFYHLAYADETHCYFQYITDDNFISNIEIFENEVYIYEHGLVYDEIATTEERVIELIEERLPPDGDEEGY